jgi:hypothetical protein
MFIGNGFQVLYTSLEPISNSRRAEILHCPLNRTWAEREKGHIPSAKEILELFKAKQANATKVIPASGERNSENATENGS